MALKDSDIREHNNSNLAHVDSNFVRGGGRRVADLTELYALASVDVSLGVSKVDQLKERVTKVWVTSEDKEYLLVDITDITGTGSSAVFNPTAWESTATVYTFSSPLSLVGNNVSIPAANTSTNGYLTSANWNTFNNKAPVSSPIFSGTVTAASLKADTITTAGDGTSTGQIFQIIGDDGINTGGTVVISAGGGGTIGGDLNLNGGSGTGSGSAGHVNITSRSGSSPNGSAGNVKILLGTGIGTGLHGRLILSSNKSTSTGDVYLNVDNVTANRDISFPNVSGTIALSEATVNTTGDQTDITGTKTFQAGAAVDQIVTRDSTDNTLRTVLRGGDIQLYGGALFPTYNISMSGTQLISTNGSSSSLFYPGFVQSSYFKLATLGGSYQGSLASTTLTDNRTYTFPNFNGNVILDAGTQTITGDKTFTGNTILQSATQFGAGYGYALGNSTGFTLTALDNGGAVMKIESNKTSLYGSYDITNGQHTFTTNLKKAEFSLANITDSTTRVYTLPNSTGTIALTNDSSSGYVRLSGVDDISGNKTFNDDIISLGGNYINVWNAANTQSASISGTNISISDNLNNRVTLHPADIEFSITGNYIGKLVSASATNGDGVTWTLPNATGTVAITLTATASLNFPSTSASTHSDLTITVTGAALGDCVVLGVPNGAVVSNSCYTAWVSATDTVTVRFNNYDSLTASDPTSGTFRVSVLKY